MEDCLLPAISIDENMIIKKWYRFVKFGEKPTNLNEKIIDSWKRSKELKIDAYGEGKSHIILAPRELKKKLDRYKKLIGFISPYIDNIDKIIKDLGCIVFLTDNEGNILYVSGEDIVLKDFARMYNFREGVAWSERAVGTTAVSMVMIEGKPVPFMADEKYCYELKKRACAAVPIRNIEDEIVAILGIAATTPIQNPQLVGILMAVEMAVENQLRMLKMNEKVRIVNEYYKTIFDSVSDAIVAVDRDGIITDINQTAKEILREDTDKLIGEKVKDVLGFYPVILDVLKTGKELSVNKTLIDTKNKKMHYKIKKVIPIMDKDKVNGCINIFEKEGIRKSKNTAKFNFSNIIGKSEEIVKVKNQAEVASKNDYNILIIGESGTGKELFAQAIHNASTRSNGPFIPVNCGAIPKDLIESEFFGYEAGAFTGANKNGNPGKFENAKGGTIFLDEIGEMPANLQIRLLRVLQEREITRIGGNEIIPVDVRVIAATNKDLIHEIKKGNFREDLFWRLNVIQIHIPSLSQRKKDIPLLMEYFINKYARDSSKCILDKKALNILMDYQWPGNVRELENTVERILAFLSGDTILPEHLSDYMISPGKYNYYDKDCSLDEAERQIISRVLDECKGNITKAAIQLGISRPTLYRKLKDRGIS